MAMFFFLGLEHARNTCSYAFSRTDLLLLVKLNELRITEMP